MSTHIWKGTWLGKARICRWREGERVRRKGYREELEAKQDPAQLPATLSLFRSFKCGLNGRMVDTEWTGMPGCLCVFGYTRAILYRRYGGEFWETQDAHLHPSVLALFGLPRPTHFLTPGFSLSRDGGQAAAGAGILPPVCVFPVGTANSSAVSWVSLLLPLSRETADASKWCPGWRWGLRLPRLWEALAASNFSLREGASNAACPSPHQIG